MQLVRRGGWLRRIEGKWKKDSVVMRSAIGQSVASNRSCAVVAKSGRTRVCFIETAGRKMGYSGSVKNARVNMPASVTTGLGKLAEKISDMRIVTGSLMGSSRGG